MKPTVNLFHRPVLLVTAIASLAASNLAKSAVNTYVWNGTNTNNWATSSNWAASPGIGVTGTSSDSRLSVFNGSGQTLIYSATQGTTVYANTAGRGLVISSASGPTANGSMTITGGSFSTLGSLTADVIGNAATGILNVSGGNFVGAGTTAGGTILGLNSGNWISTLTVSGTGSATLTKLQMSAGTATVNLDGGTLAANEIVDVDNSGVTANSNTTFNFNGGTLTAGTGAVTTFMTGLSNAYVKAGGAKIDAVDKNITIGQALLHDTALGVTLDGGLNKSGSGSLTLSNTSTYTGATTVASGKLIVNGNISTSSLTTVSAGSLGGTGTVGAAIINGDLAPGDGGIESLNFGGNLTLAGTSNFEISATANTADLAISSALLAFGGILNVSNIAGTLANGQSFDLFNWGTTTGTFSAVNLPTLGSGLSWDQSSLYTNGTITVVPEPNVAALLGGLGVLALLGRRR